MDWQRDLLGLLAGFVLAVVTTPVGVSGAVFLLPVQLSLLHVPSPRITPTNLLYNVISGPGGLTRYRRRGQFDRELTLQLITGSVPGVVIGAFTRVYVAADPDVFRLLAAGVLAPVGLFILGMPTPGSLRRRLHPRMVRGWRSPSASSAASMASGAARSSALSSLGPGWRSRRWHRPRCSRPG